MNKIFINGKEFPNEDLPKSYGEEPKRNIDSKFFNPKPIALTKEGYEELKEFYKNFDKYKEFAQSVLTPEEYDVWLYQNQYIKETLSKNAN